MAIYDDDVLCRFIRPRKEYWSPQEHRPKAPLFKQPALSLWHEGRVAAKQSTLCDLQIEGLAGTGQAHHTAGDYRRFAEQAGEGEQEGLDLALCIQWEPAHVHPPWQRWQDAHVEVTTSNTMDAKSALREFRRLLALNARVVIPPAFDDDLNAT